jgi:hypothetical protein
MRLTKGERFVYNWQYGYLGDCFDGQLAKLIAKSDNKNRTKLYKGFPEETEAVTWFQSKEGWWDGVQDKAERINERGE